MNIDDLIRRFADVMPPTSSEPTPTAQVTCTRCGTRFDCRPGGECWCAAEPLRLPLDAATAECLCPDCLRSAAATAP